MNVFRLGFTSVRGKEWMRHELQAFKISRTGNRRFEKIY